MKQLSLKTILTGTSRLQGKEGSAIENYDSYTLYIIKIDILSIFFVLIFA